jgi:hypothetical protein
MLPVGKKIRFMGMDINAILQLSVSTYAIHSSFHQSFACAHHQWVEDLEKQ